MSCCRHLEKKLEEMRTKEMEKSDTLSKKNSTDFIADVTVSFWMSHKKKEYIYKQDLALNNLQGLRCHKTPTNRPIIKVVEKMLFSNQSFKINECLRSFKA